MEQENPKNQQILCNPYQVNIKQLNYDKLIQQFGCNKINHSTLQRIQKLTGKKPHRFLRRYIFFADRDLQLLLDKYEKGQPFFLYTGRGPSSQSMHLGHLIPFIFTKYLQDVFQVPLVIQISDDQKYFHRGKQNEDIQFYQKLGIENIKDIIACGFDLDKTFMFLNSEYIGHMYKNVCRFQKQINLTKIKSIFGIDMTYNSGIISYPAAQAAPSLSSSFPFIFGEKNILCLIPAGIDQDPYFRMTRDVCNKLDLPKPCSIYSKFFPSLKGQGEKMSASNPDSGIFLIDKPNEIKRKINKAISGGQVTVEQQRQKGADLQIDISIKYLQFFLQSDQQLDRIKKQYSTGKMLTSEVKQILTNLLIELVQEHRQTKNKVTDQLIREYLKMRPLNFISKQKQNQIFQTTCQLCNNQKIDSQLGAVFGLIIGQLLQRQLEKGQNNNSKNILNTINLEQIHLQQSQLAICLCISLSRSNFYIQNIAKDIFHWNKSNPKYNNQYLLNLLTIKQKINKAFKYSEYYFKKSAQLNCIDTKGIYRMIIGYSIYSSYFSKEISQNNLQSKLNLLRFMQIILQQVIKPKQNETLFPYLYQIIKQINLTLKCKLPEFQSQEFQIQFVEQLLVKLFFIFLIHQIEQALSYGNLQRSWHYHRIQKNAQENYIKAYRVIRNYQIQILKEIQAYCLNKFCQMSKQYQMNIKLYIQLEQQYFQVFQIFNNPLNQILFFYIFLFLFICQYIRIQTQ